MLGICAIGVRSINQLQSNLAKTETEGEAAGIQTRVGFNSDDIDADHANLRARGVDADPAVMRMGDPVPPMFFFRDPDGNRFFIVQGS